MTGLQLQLDREDFLANHWQQKPLLIKNGVEGFKPPIDANELAGLALEDDVESRLVEFHSNNWQLHHGPFSEQDFQRPHPWTLLVQAVDLYIPEVAELLQLIDFIPQWRVDDIMISYAVDGGSVGPHYDNYDVFLLQGEGQRTWKLGQLCDNRTPLLPNDDLRILNDFRSEAEYTLSAGDILYVPPGVAHWGIAKGECMTYSIGFRAPRINELLSRNVDAVLEQIDVDSFYRDPKLSALNQPGEIKPEAILAARQQLLATLEGQLTNHWFGELVTEPKYELESPAHDHAVADLHAFVETSQLLALLPTSRIAWQQNGDELAVYANGECLIHSQAVLPTLIHLCEYRALDSAFLGAALARAECAILLEQLLECACFELE
ncbi:MAG: cupin domain-containing protein [Halioglobus sp.]